MLTKHILSYKSFVTIKKHIKQTKVKTKKHNNIQKLTYAIRNWDTKNES